MDWSSDGCSSDLLCGFACNNAPGPVLKRRVGQDHCGNWLLCARADRIRLKLQIRVLSSVEICGCIAPQPLALRFPSGRSVLRDEPLRQCTPVGSTEDFHSNLCRNRSFRQGDKMDLNLVIAILCPESLNAVVHVCDRKSTRLNSSH